MDQITSIMLPPLVACLILTGIHTYLGLHVVSRGVIFVDLALAQIAALGSTFAFLLGYEPQSRAGYFYSLGFAFVGAAIFSLSRLKDKRIPQEALIGITFAVASSAAILIADRAPQGAEHVEQMLTGSILWISWPTILKTLAIYSVVALFHVLFRDKFILISMEPEEAERRGVAVRWWDFLFYLSFGFVITSSVAIAGVLLVFSFLIIPSVIGMLYSSRIGTRLIIGWISGTLVSLIGLYLSYRVDFPSGPSIVCSFGAVLILAALVRYYASVERKGVAAAKIVGTSAGLTLLILLAVHFRPYEEEPTDSVQSQLEIVTQAFKDLEAEDSGSRPLELLKANLETLLDGLEQGGIQPTQAAVRRLGEFGDAAFAPAIHEVLESTKDVWMKYYGARSLMALGDKEGIHHLVQLLGIPAPVFLKSQVLDTLKGIVGDDYGYNPIGNEQENEKAFNRFEVWWHQYSDRIQWDATGRHFKLQ